MSSKIIVELAVEIIGPGIYWLIVYHGRQQ